MFTINCGMQYERVLATGLFYCADGEAYLLTSFGLQGGLVRLGNVYDRNALATLNTSC